MNVTKLLIDHGVNIESTNQYENTALHKAAKYGNWLTLDEEKPFDIQSFTNQNVNIVRDGCVY